MFIILAIYFFFIFMWGLVFCSAFRNNLTRFKDFSLILLFVLLVIIYTNHKKCSNKKGKVEIINKEITIPLCMMHGSMWLFSSRSIVFFLYNSHICAHSFVTFVFYFSQLNLVRSKHFINFFAACLSNCENCVDQASCVICKTGYFTNAVGQCSGK